MLIPKPVQMEFSPGRFLLQAPVRIAVPPDSAALHGLGELLSREISELTGTTLPLTGIPHETSRPSPSHTITLRSEAPLAELGDEGYELTVTEESVVLRAATPHGVFNGTRTLLQLLPLGRSAELSLPCLRILDRPRYSWRGFLLDCSRHFMDVPFLKRMLDLMALHKLNVFHWHLIDNGGWRLEVDAFPELTEIAAWRGPAHDRYGGFYTKDQVREVVAYAAERFITVVPEFEMPGHCDAALAAYPEFCCSGESYKPPTQSLPHDNLGWWYRPEGSATNQPRPFCAGRDEVFAFHEAVFDEALELFPSPIWHVGGDERPIGIWEKCPLCQARMRTEGLADEHALQNWFMRRITGMLADKGKRVLSWAVSRSNAYGPRDMDDLGHRALIENWHDGTAFSAQQGWDVVNAHNLFTYLDYPERPGTDKPLWMPLLSTAKAYSFNPTPAELSPDQARHVLGGEACLWTETAPQSQVDAQTFPRLLALAEVFWTPQELRDYADFEQRLRHHRPRLEQQGVQFGA